MPTRDRAYRLKITPLAGRSLLGFANNADEGVRVTDIVSSTAPGKAVLDTLYREHLAHPDVDFAYAYLDADQPRLFKIAEGVVTEVQTLYLGQRDAFEALQRARHTTEIDHAPEAMHTFMCGLADLRPNKDMAEIVVPEALSRTIVAMQNVFVATGSRDVGGVAIPYVASPYGTQICDYAYAVTDAILSDIRAGTVIPHGTAQGGGFSVCVTDVRGRDGLVIYWLQKPGGKVILRDGRTYVEHDFAGSPSVFKDAVRQALGCEVELFFSEAGAGPIRSLHTLVDQSGRPRLSVAVGEQGLTFAWVQNTPDSFRAKQAIPLEKMTAVDAAESGPVAVTLTDNRDSLAIGIPSTGEGATHLSLMAHEVDALIMRLAELRASMKVAVPNELSSPSRLIAQLDPAWRTRHEVHPDAQGILLKLRHSGYGWQAYLLPYHEAQALGQWLVDNSKDPNGNTPE
ncbi:hypothetical protein PQQ77_15045 [Paraburkholderia strydomiana]